ncbi:hypothetical protein FZ103_19400 [Streptomonospora sp. PA3]|uniref:DUF6247 family protein n=1 Tax=Streptomonospora sp. PA3 TaxID=2607326 RepID=UPI0012DCD882|nr:DUF6247 family protein [Streptomonospora sp. PA3]MUL43306.1 hypothetical protein [Streptomonospora sp. PA3]
MTEQHSEDCEAPRIPRPAATPEALPKAVSRITPSRLKEFDRRLVEACTEALELQRLSPLHLFCFSWAHFIEIERHPATARRLAELENMVGTGHPDTRSAVQEISRILRETDAALGR